MTLDDLVGRATITVPEAAQVLHLGRDTAYRAVERGELPCLRIGRRLVIPVPALLALLGIPQTDSEAGPATGPTTATASTPPQGVSDEQHAPAPASVSNVRPIRGS